MSEDDREDPARSWARATLAEEIRRTIERRDLSQAEAATIMGADQPIVSKIVNGHIDGFSLERLMDYLISLGNDGEIVVRAVDGYQRRGRLSVTLETPQEQADLVCTIIGIDCSTQPKRCGLALAQRDGASWRLAEAHAGRGDASSLQEMVASWVEAADGRVLLAFDAPLGWPDPLAAAISEHVAGSKPLHSADAMFFRHTDRFVTRMLGKRPLAVGADRIARTAHWTLGFLADLRNELDERIPLAFGPPSTRVSAIEVYPAATAKAHKPDVRRYKEETPRSALLAGHLDLGEHEAIVAGNDDAFDAAVCVLAGLDFLAGACHYPDDWPLALKEGWIWFRRDAGSGDGSSS